MFLGTKSYLWLLKSAKKSARFFGIFSQILTGFLSLDNQADVGKYLFHSKYIMKVGFINIIQNHGERNSFIFFSYLLPYDLRYSKETGARVYIDTHKLHNCYIQLKNGDDGYGDELFLRDGWHTNSWSRISRRDQSSRSLTSETSQISEFEIDSDVTANIYSHEK